MHLLFSRLKAHAAHPVILSCILLGFVRTRGLRLSSFPSLSSIGFMKEDPHVVETPLALALIVAIVIEWKIRPRFALSHRWLDAFPHGCRSRLTSSFVASSCSTAVRLFFDVVKMHTTIERSPDGQGFAATNGMPENHMKLHHRREHRPP